VCREGEGSGAPGKLVIIINWLLGEGVRGGKAKSPEAHVKTVEGMEPGGRHGVNQKKNTTKERNIAPDLLTRKSHQ